MNFHVYVFLNKFYIYFSLNSSSPVSFEFQTPNTKAFKEKKKKPNILHH